MPMNATHCNSPSGAATLSLLSAFSKASNPQESGNHPDRGTSLSFRLKIIVGAALIQTLLLLVLILSAMDFLRSSNEAHLSQRSDMLAEVLIQSIRNTQNLSTSVDTASMIDQVNELEGIAYIRFFTGNRTESSEFSVPESDAPGGIFQREYLVRHKGESLGQLVIGLSKIAAENTLSQAQHWILAIALTGLLLISIFSLALGRYLSRRIESITEAFDKMSTHGPGEQLAVSGKDELTRLSIAFNRLSTQLMDNDSELKRALRLAKAGEAKHQAMLGASLDAIVTIDRHGLIVHCNDAITDMTGWPAQELLHKSVTRTLLPDFTDHLHELASLRSLPQRSRDRGLRLTSQVYSWDGTAIPVEMAISSIPGETGQVIVVYLRDITERLENETELRLAAHAFESTEAIFITNQDGTIIRVNKAFTHITGYSPDEAIGKDPGLLASGKHDKSFFKLMKATLLQDGKWQGEVYNKRKNGEIYPEHLNITAVRDSDGQISHFVAHSVDISQQKQNEQNLRTARHAAEQASAAKSRFLATMSHEIRTPLNGVMGILGILKSSNINREQQEYINTAQTSAEHLLNVINDILDYSRMEAGKLKLEPREFELLPLVQQIQGMMHPLAENQQLSLELDLAEDLPTAITTDPERLKQILLNLISNAIKFTPKGTIKLGISHCLSDDGKDSDQIRFEVLDTGIGIAEEFHETLFDEFSMIDQTTSRRQEGSGLGLAICKRLVTLMDGQLGLISEPGKGSCFWFTLPLLPVLELETESSRIVTEMNASFSDQLNSADSTQQLIMTEGQEQAKAEQNSDFSPAPVTKTEEQPVTDTTSRLLPEDARLLLAEDNPANQLVIKTLLSKAGFTVDIAHNGAEATDMVESGDYTLVLMDISMPVVDGLQATQNIRNMPHPKRDIPIIAITAHALSGDRERFLESGMDDYLTKPVNRTQMIECVHKWLAVLSSTDEYDHPHTQSQNTTNNDMETNSMTGMPDIDSAPIIDFSVLDQLAEDTSPELVPELIELYSGDADHRIARIEKAIVEDDIEVLSFEVHTIGSSAGAHGNIRLFKLAREIERLCQEKEFEQALSIARHFPDIAKESVQELVKHRETLI